MRYIHIDSVESTNTYAKGLNGVPDDDLTVVRAGRQTGGRGRGGNSYFSNHTGGLWASLITPIDDISTHFRYNRAISIAILESLKDICADANAGIKIKWPNDIYWNGKKISGILLENISGKPGMMIIGFGVNVNIGIDDFPADIRDSSTSALIETGREISIERLLDNVLKIYKRHINNVDEHAVHQLYTANLYKKGLPAAVDGRFGVFITVDTDGRLRLETDRGQELFSSGTLRFTRKNDNDIKTINNKNRSVNNG